MRIEFIRELTNSGFCRFRMENLLSAYFDYHDVFIGQGEKQIWVEYNKLYHFYSISLFELLGNRDTTAHFEKAIRLIRYHGHKITYVTPSWRNENGRQIKGIKFFVEATNPYQELGSVLLDIRTGELIDPPKTDWF